jgi:alanine racemase
VGHVPERAGNRGRDFIGRTPSAEEIATFHGEGAMRPVRVAGRPGRIVGRVSMDMITVDLSEAPAAKVGDEVVLWGEGVPIEPLAAAAGTIAYELLCGVTQRVSMRVV